MTKKPAKRSALHRKKASSASKQSPLSFKDAMAKLQLKVVRLVSLSSKITVKERKLPDKFEFTVSAGMGTAQSAGATFHIEVKLETLGQPKDNKGDGSQFKLEAIYQCVFKLDGLAFNDITHLADELCDAGVRIVWPYLRELTQSTASKMALPPIPMPLLLVR